MLKWSDYLIKKNEIIKMKKIITKKGIKIYSEVKFDFLISEPIFKNMYIGLICFDKKLNKYYFTQDILISDLSYDTICYIQKTIKNLMIKHNIK